MILRHSAESAFRVISRDSVGLHVIFRGIPRDSATFHGIQPDSEPLRGISPNSADPASYGMVRSFCGVTRLAHLFLDIKVQNAFFPRISLAKRIFRGIET